MRTKEAELCAIESSYVYLAFWVTMEIPANRSSGKSLEASLDKVRVGPIPGGESLSKKHGRIRPAASRANVSE